MIAPSLLRHNMNKLVKFCNIDLECWIESDAELVSSEFPILNHFHPVLLKQSNSGIGCVFRIIVMLEKSITNKGKE